MLMLLLQGLLECASTLMKLHQLLQCTEIDVQAESETRWKVGCYMKLFLSKEVRVCVLTCSLLMMLPVNDNNKCTQHTGCVTAAELKPLRSLANQRIVRLPLQPHINSVIKVLTLCVLRNAML
jgi:hypothetical protein